MRCLIRDHRFNQKIGDRFANPRGSMSGAFEKSTVVQVTHQTRIHFADIMEEARAWQKRRGSEGWNYPFNDAWMLPRIERSELFLTYFENEPVAAFRLL